MMAADFSHRGQVAVLDNTDLTSAESENNIINTMVERETALLRKIDINVAESEKRTGKNTVNMQETYTVYLIETRPADSGAEGGPPVGDSPWRRYSDFELLRTYLLVTYPYVVIPPLPEKRAEFVWHRLSADNLDPDFVERRRMGLENFLMRVASHSVLSSDKIFYQFLTEEKGWREAVVETGFQDKADSRLKSLSAMFRVKNADKVRAKVADRMYGVYKVHGNYGRVFSEWSAIENEMGDGLQSAGHPHGYKVFLWFCRHAASVDDILEEEEHYADQLKEYLFLHRRSQAVRVFSLKGMSSKLFGQESPEQRESRLAALQLNIQTSEEGVLDKNDECRQGLHLLTLSLCSLCGCFSPPPASESSMRTAWEDVKRFKEQKDRELREALISYAIMQISMCKKGIQVWSNAKECFNKM
ncbi:hypothetical protein CRUP_027752 [Coryphaenoides rupestris]|nr:hypothetical protein CRUP_027752 [Coryphaenoides rupestris]